jgi:hypothetical protein
MEILSVYCYTFISQNQEQLLKMVKNYRPSARIEPADSGAAI